MRRSVVRGVVEPRERLAERCIDVRERVACSCRAPWRRRARTRGPRVEKLVEPSHFVLLEQRVKVRVRHQGVVVAGHLQVSLEDSDALSMMCVGKQVCGP